MSPLRGAVLEAQLLVLQQLVAQLPASGLARALPLDELLALDLADGPACLAVLAKMRAALMLAGGGGGGGPARTRAPVCA